MTVFKQWVRGEDKTKKKRKGAFGDEINTYPVELPQPWVIVLPFRFKVEAHG